MNGACVVNTHAARCCRELEQAGGVRRALGLHSRVEMAGAGCVRHWVGAALRLWFEFKWEELALVAIPVVLFSFLFARAPLIPFIVGSAGLAVGCARSPGEGGEWLDVTWTLTKQMQFRFH